MTYFIDAIGIREFERTLHALGQGVVPAAAYAINDTALFARRAGAKEIASEINLKPAYIDSKLTVTQRASTTSLEAVVTGRDRPTSLARFAQGSPRFGKQRQAPKVRVKASGGASPIRNGFYMRLKRGNSIISAENNNIGLAIRLKEGERISNKNQMVPIGSGVYLLYGPSVAQAYRSAAQETSEAVAENLAARFTHHLARELR